MKKSLLLLSFCMSFCLNAQVEDNYRRSSLSIVLLDTDDFPNKETVINAFKSFNESDFPDKYNNFQVKEGAVFDPKQYKFSDSIQKIKDEQAKKLKDDREDLKKEAAEQEKNGTGNKGVDEMAKKTYGGLDSFLNSSVLDEMNLMQILLLKQYKQMWMAMKRIWILLLQLYKLTWMVMK